MAVADADRMASEEVARFRAVLPSLLEAPALAGKWVVFKDGAVVQSFDDRTEGYHWAVEHLGRLPGFVLAPAEPGRMYRVGGAGMRVLRR